MTPPLADNDEHREVTALRRSPIRLGIAAVSALMLIAMMFVTVIDVIGRYVFNHPLSGGTEITALLLAAVIFIGLPAVCYDDEHVTVDLIVDRLPDWIQPLRVIGTHIVSSCVLGVVAWRLFIQAQAIGGYGERTLVLHFPVAALAYLCSVATGVAALVTLALVFRRTSP